jgi:cyanophycin synthetase
MDNAYLDIPEKDCIVFSYTNEKAGVHAARAAVNMANALISGQHYDITKDLEALQKIRKRESMGPSTQAIADEALKRDIPVTRFNLSSLTYLGQGKNQKLFQAAVAGTTSAIAVELAQNKDVTKTVLKRGSISIPEGVVASNTDELREALARLGFPVVIKPLNGNHGRGITTNVTAEHSAAEAFKLAQEVSEDVIVERHIEGLDHRFLVINYKLAAVARRMPASVIGDGRSTISELVEEKNKDPRRGSGHENVLTRIKIDEHTLKLLQENKLIPESIIEEGKLIHLKSTANLSTGGTADDVTDMVHPDNIFLAERIARLMGLDICGIDIVTKDVSEPITDRNGAVVEVNAGPGLRMHLSPSSGQERNVAAPIVEMLFPEGSSARIPLVAITGTNGKTTTTRLIAHLAKVAGYSPGFTTTDGIYINGQIVETGDCSGPRSAAVVLADPIVDFAVLECARGGILRSGLGFDKCDISIVTNVSGDHLGLDGIDTVEQLARLKSVVPKCTFDSGYSILNADDDLVYSMGNELLCNVALFSMSPDNPRIKRHIDEENLAAFVENGNFYITKGYDKRFVAVVNEVPLTFNGQAEFMIKNVLPAILAAFISEIPVKVIGEGLRSFIPSADTTPGRMNHFQFSNFSLLLDYAHNEEGLAQVKKYAGGVQASVKVGIIGAAGDRRAEDIKALGRIAAETFDELIIKHDEDGRGRTTEQMSELILAGVVEINPAMPVQIISDETEALRYAIDHVKPGAWIFTNTDDVHRTSSFLKELHNADITGKHI